MGTHPIFESDFDCLTEILKVEHGTFQSEKDCQQEIKQGCTQSSSCIQAEQVVRLREGRQVAPKNFDENSEWEIEEFGGLYLCWGKKKTRKPDGSIGKQYYLKGDSDHRVWIKWTVAYHDKIRWSAEKQEKLVGVNKDALKKIIQDKKAWPLPSTLDGIGSGWKERRAICSQVG